MGGTITVASKRTVCELTEESFAVGVKLLPEQHCALAAGQVLTEGS